MKLKVKFKNQSDRHVIIYDAPGLKSVDEKLVLAPRQELVWEVPQDHFYSRFTSITFLKSKVRYKERDNWKKLLGLEGKRLVADFVNESDFPTTLLNLDPENFSTSFGGTIFPQGIPVRVEIPVFSKYVEFKKWLFKSYNALELDPFSEVPGAERVVRKHHWVGEDRRSEKELAEIKKETTRIRKERAQSIISH